MVIQIRTNLDRFKNYDKTKSFKQSEKNNNISDINFSGSPFKLSEAAKKKLYTSKGFHKFAKLTENPVLLDATVVLGLACFLRPLTILKLPGAEKRDKQYAAAHSIVSGTWGYITALALFNPISNAVNNVAKKAEDKPEYLKNTYIKNKKNREAFKFVAGYGPKLILQPMVAAVTIALLPLAMGLFFNKEKRAAKKQALQANDAAQNPTTQESKKSDLKITEKTSNIQFKGKTPKKPGPLTRAIEPLIEKMVHNKYIKNFSEKMAKSDDQKSVFMKNLLTTGQALLGTLVYILSTFKNKKIEEDRKKTLAANQFITWGISAIGTFTVSGMLQKKFKIMGQNFEKYNAQDLKEKFAKNTANLDVKSTKYKELSEIQNKALKTLESHKGGIGTVAPTMIVFAFIYRYLTPILATPLADIYKKHFIKDPAVKKQTVKA